MVASALDRANREGWLAATVLAVAIVFGGGGSPAPLSELVVQLVAAVLAVIWLATLAAPTGRSVPRAAIAIAALLVVVPLIQLIPLPPALWQQLPGREAERAALALIGHENSWRPLTLAPARTLAALLALLPAALMVVMTAALDGRGRRLLLWVAAGGGLLTVLLGAAQLAGGPDGPLRLYNSDTTYLEGFQANRNSTADLLLLALLATVALIRDLTARGKIRTGTVALIASAGAATLFGIGVVLTGSRAGMLLLVPTLAGAALMLRPWLKLSGRRIAMAILAIALIGSLGTATALYNPAVAHSIQRFSLGEELRPELWADSIYTARGHAPFGAGMGNFVPATLANERLEIVRPNMPNRAHNEPLELMVEAGIVGLFVATAIGGILVPQAWRNIRQGTSRSTGPVMFGCLALSILALHSLVDYPFRSMSLALLAAAGAGMMLPLGGATVRRDHSDRLEDSR